MRPDLFKSLGGVTSGGMTSTVFDQSSIVNVYEAGRTLGRDDTWIITSFVDPAATSYDKMKLPALSPFSITLIPASFTVALTNHSPSPISGPPTPKYMVTGIDSLAVQLKR